MSTAPRTYNGTNIEGIDWHGPMTEINDELIERRLNHLFPEGHGDQDWFDAEEWAMDVASKFALELHPHLVGKV